MFHVLLRPFASPSHVLVQLFSSLQLGSLLKRDLQVFESAEKRPGSLNLRLCFLLLPVFHVLLHPSAGPSICRLCVALHDAREVRRSAFDKLA